MPSRIDEAGHTKAFDYTLGTGGKAEIFSSVGGTRTDNTSVRLTLFEMRQASSQPTRRLGRL